MGDAARELADSLHLLRLGQSALALPQCLLDNAQYAFSPSSVNAQARGD
jgi:hypothetical protein